MNKTVKILAVLLAVQLLLAVGVGFSKRDVTATKESVALVSFDAEKIDRISLEGPENAKVTLAKRKGNWVLPDSGKFPASNNKVKQLLERLKSLRSGTPVATSSGARERFKVSDEAYERRITLSEGKDAIARLYLGSSPSRRLIHARSKDSDAIYAVKLAAYDVPVKGPDWEDKTILTLPKSAITSIGVQGLTLKLSAPAVNGDSKADKTSPPPVWHAEGLAKGRQLKAGAVDKLVGLLANLQFEKVLGHEAKDEYDMTAPVLELTLTRNASETLTYRVGKTRDKEQYTLKVSNRPEYFQLASYKAKPLIESASLKNLTKTMTKEEEEKTTSEQPSKP